MFFDIKMNILSYGQLKRVETDVGWISTYNIIIPIWSLTKDDVFQHPNEYIILWDNRKWLKWMLDEYQPIKESLQFNSSVRSFSFDEFMAKRNLENLLGTRVFEIVYESDWEGKRIATKNLKAFGSFNEKIKKSFT